MSDQENQKQQMVESNCNNSEHQNENNFDLIAACEEFLKESQDEACLDEIFEFIEEMKMKVSDSKQLYRILKEHFFSKLHYHQTINVEDDTGGCAIYCRKCFECNHMNEMVAVSQKELPIESLFCSECCASLLVYNSLEVLDGLDGLEVYDFIQDINNEVFLS